MSTIPNNAMPHAVAEPEGQAEQQNGSSFIVDSAQRIAEAARANPKTAAAVGAGVVAVTAATVALSRRGSGGGKSGGSGGSGGRSSKTKS